MRNRFPEKVKRFFLCSNLRWTDCFLNTPELFLKRWNILFFKIIILNFESLSYWLQKVPEDSTKEFGNIVRLIDYVIHPGAKDLLTHLSYLNSR